MDYFFHTTKCVFFLLYLLVANNAFAVEYLPYIGGGFVANNTAVSGGENGNTKIDDETFTPATFKDFNYSTNINTQSKNTFALDIHSGIQIKFGNFYIAPEIGGYLSQKQNIVRTNTKEPYKDENYQYDTIMSFRVNNDWSSTSINSMYSAKDRSDTIASIKPILDIKIKLGYLLKKWNFGIFGGINYL